MNQNLQAFLHLIRTGEGTLGTDGYRTLYGGGLFDSFDDHPRKKVTAGKWTSSAAGAYQILQKTWDGLVKANPWTLTDFTPMKQDQAAVILIRRRGAYDDVVAGRYQTAIIKCNKEWASLPLSPYGQPTLKMDRALEIIKQAGGVFADAPKPKEDTVNPLIIPVALELVKELPNFAKIFTGDKTVSEKNVEAVVKATDVVIKAVGAQNGQDAIEKIKADPEVKLVANEAVKLNTADLLDAFERVNAIDQANIKAAREFNATEPFIINTRHLKLKFIHLLSVVFVVFAGAFVSFHFVALDKALQGAVITLMIIGGWNGVKDYWMSSSAGSARKTELMGDK